MDADRMEAAIENIDTRLARVEQILPTLATREELRAAIQSAVASAVAPLATREELHAAIQAAIAPLATRAEMYAAIKEEGERSRRHTDVLIEDVRDDNRLILEHLIALSARVDALAQR